MPEEFPQSIPQDPTTALLSEFGTRLTEIEEKQRLIKDRLLLIGENLISTKEDIEKQNLEFKGKIKQAEFEVKTIKQIIKRIISELGNLARKPEVEILQRQIKMFQPLEVARIQDVQNIVSEELSKQLKTKKSK